MSGCAGTEMPYVLLGQLISVVLLARYVLTDGASIRAKLLTSFAFIIALALQQAPPPFALCGLLLQTVVAIGLVIAFKARR